MANVIRVGDLTSHGGEVLTSSVEYFLVSGKPVAVVGDKCRCPVSGHQDCTIISGSATHSINGKAVAYHGDKTSCGATLISSVVTFSQT